MKHILVIDDEVDTLEYLEKALTRLGYEVKVARGGEEGIKFLMNGYRADLVVTDINMPKMNGNAVAKSIRSSNRSDIPIVAITGSGDQVNRELFDFVLIKPFSPKILIKAMSLLV